VWGIAAGLPSGPAGEKTERAGHLDEMPPGNGMLRNYSFLTFLAAGPF
jgi:hypothetical protein